MIDIPQGLLTPIDQQWQAEDELERVLVCMILGNLLVDLEHRVDERGGPLNREPLGKDIADHVVVIAWKVEPVIPPAAKRRVGELMSLVPLPLVRCCHDPQARRRQDCAYMERVDGHDVVALNGGRAEIIWKRQAHLRRVGFVASAHRQDLRAAVRVEQIHHKGKGAFVRAGKFVEQEHNALAAQDPVGEACNGTSCKTIVARAVASDIGSLQQVTLFP